MRSRTPPELKWLLVERATLMGDLAKLTQRQEALAAEIGLLQPQVQALDRTIQLCDARIRAEAAGQVFRHRREYGQRGALKEFLKELLKSTDEGLSGWEIGQRARSHFSLNFVTKGEFRTFMVNNVRPRLGELRAAGLVETRPADTCRPGATRRRRTRRRGI